MSVTTDTPLLLARLRQELPAEALLTGPADLAAHSRDTAPFSAYGTPVVVAVPRTAEQVEHIMRTAYALDVPVVPQGARTGLAGAANAVDGCVVLSTTAMDRILSVDPANRLVRCEPGVTTRRLAEAVAEHGLTYPPDPASWETCTIGAITAAGHTPSALELLDRATTQAVVDLGTHPLMRAGSAATLIVESDGTDPGADLTAMELLCKEAGSEQVATSATPEEAREIIEARRLVTPAIGAYMASRGGGLTAFIEDVAVPRSELPALIGLIEGIADRHRLRVFTLGHAGDGNLHPTVVFDPCDPGELDRARTAYDEIMAAGLALGGTTTGEHGIGTLKREWLERELGPVSLELQRGLKRLFDPKNLLNPGKVVRA